MIACKGFDPGLVCRGHQFQMGLNTTEEANCVQNGFHCAENPLDCLTYYSDMDRSEYYLVDAGGDIDEDGNDTKISCTELRIIKRLSKKQFLLFALTYMAQHPLREWNWHVKKDMARASDGYVIVRGSDPVACGKKGDILAFAKESRDNSQIVQIAMAKIDGIKFLPDVWYGADLQERLGKAG